MGVTTGGPHCFALKNFGNYDNGIHHFELLLCVQILGLVAFWELWTWYATPNLTPKPTKYRSLTIINIESWEVFVLISLNFYKYIFFFSTNSYIKIQKIRQFKNQFVTIKKGSII